jgi:outer membrane protein TolC
VLVGLLWAPSGQADPLTLAEAMARAASNTEAARLLELDVASAEAGERTALGELTPLLRATGSSVRNQEEIGIGDSVFVNLWDHSANIRVSIDVFRGTAIPSWRASRHTTEAARERARWEAAGLRLAAARAYLAALTSRQNLEAARESVALRQTSLEQAELVLEAGYALAADVSRARFSLIEAESAVLDAEQELADALDLLAFLVDVPSLLPDDLSTASMPAASSAPGSVDGDRGDIRALEREIESRDAFTRGQWLSFLPVLSVAGQYNIGPESLRAPDGTYWFISLTASWDLFDYRRYGRLDAARTAESAAELRRDEALRQLDTDLTTGRRRLDTAEARLVLAEEAERVAVETRDLEAERYSGGDITVLDLVTADVALFRAQVASNLARLERDLALVQLAYLQGRLEDDSWMQP